MYYNDTLVRIERVAFERNANTENKSFVVKTINSLLIFRIHSSKLTFQMAGLLIIKMLNGHLSIKSQEIRC